MKKGKKDLYKKGKCGQGYESDKCLNCKYCMGLDIGLIACGKGFDKKVVILGEQ